MYVQLELARPDELEAVLRVAPVAYVPLGTYEHHGWHLPVCFDGIKAHALCLKTAERTGGVVLPPFFYGTGGGHIGYKWTIMPAAEEFAPLLAQTLDSLVRFGFTVVVLLTGHYPGEQIALVKRMAAEAGERHPEARFYGLPEHEVCTPLDGDPFPGDHAAKYETSIALALNPDWVKRDWLTPGRDPAQVALPESPRGERSSWDPTHPLYAIFGQDPRTTASAENGAILVEQIVSGLTTKVSDLLATVPSHAPRS